MIQTQIQGMDELLRRLRRGRDTLMPRIGRTLGMTLDEAVLWARQQRLSGPRPTVLQARSGRLRASFAATVRPGSHAIVAQLGFINQRPIYAGVHEFGAVIRPKRARFLAIPLRYGLGGPRGLPNTFVRGRVIYQNTSGRAVPMFLLASQVTIPARPVFRPTWYRFRPRLLERLHEQLAL